jgi:sulfur-carrier protein
VRTRPGLGRFVLTVRARRNFRTDTIGAMATLRLFAQAREAAGVGTTVCEGSSVQEVLDIAVSRFGPGFEAVLTMSKVWVNGEEVPFSSAVTDKDEVAVLPPVSGGMR